MLENLNVVGWPDDQKDAHVWACHEEIRRLKARVGTLEGALVLAVKNLDGMIQGSAIEGARPSGLYGVQSYPTAGEVEEAIDIALEAIGQSDSETI